MTVIERIEIAYRNIDTAHTMIVLGGNPHAEPKVLLANAKQELFFTLVELGAKELALKLAFDL